MMLDQPVLRTPRLLLRPFALADAPRVQELAGAPEVADTTLNMPYPYADGVAEAWIAGHADQFLYRTGVCYAVTLQGEPDICGCVSLGMTQPHRRAELGYWLGAPFWGRGYMTEAAAAPASGRVLEKIGMTREGLLRGHVFKDGMFEDLVVYGLMRGR